MNWRKVCTPKALGGLGIRMARDNNMALSSKIGWRVTNESKPLWTKVLKQKYSICKNPRNWKNNKKASPIWKCIFSNKNLLYKNFKWAVGNG